MTNIDFIKVIDFIIFIMGIDGDNLDHDIFSWSFRALIFMLVGAVGGHLTYGGTQQLRQTCDWDQDAAADPDAGYLSGAYSLVDKPSAEAEPCSSLLDGERQSLCCIL